MFLHRRVFAASALALVSVLPVAASAFRNSKTLAVQIALDRLNLSCNAIDGSWGRKSQVALATWCALNGKPLPQSPESAFDLYFSSHSPLFTTVTVQSSDHSRLCHIPSTAEAKSRLPALGYETISEMLAERGHLSETALRRLNPRLAWPNPPPGSVVVIPNVADPGSSRRRKRSPENTAASLRISLSRFEITAFNAAGKLIALFPCSIAAQKSKRPVAGEISIVTLIPDPDYTWTAERADRNGRIARHVLPPGPNNPVGTDWLGLSLPSYGIHGTPTPERIGRAESHGCFRLANWNARRLRSICTTATAVIIED